MNLRTTARAGKCSEHGSNRWAAPASIHRIYRFPVLTPTTGQSEYKHDNGEISQVKIEVAGMGTRRVRLAGLPPETPDEAVNSPSMVR